MVGLLPSVSIMGRRVDNTRAHRNKTAVLMLENSKRACGIPRQAPFSPIALSPPVFQSLLVCRRLYFFSIAHVGI